MAQKQVSEITKGEPDVDVTPETPTTSNTTMTSANTWYSYTFPANTKAWALRCRGAYDILYNYDGEDSPYLTLKSGETLAEDTTPTTIYFRCATAGQIIEIEVWT